jgi:hypothetical protein
MTDRLHALLFALLLAVAAPSFAQEAPAAGAPPAPVSWSSLSPQQQQVLSKFGGQWSSLPPGRQQALAHGSDRWLNMSQAERAQARDRFSRYRTLPPEQRQALRDRWQHFQSLPPSQQEALRENYRRFQQMTPERRQELREQWRQATPAQRQQWLQHAREKQGGHKNGQAHPMGPPHYSSPHPPH